MLTHGGKHCAHARECTCTCTHTKAQVPPPLAPSLTASFPVPIVRTPTLTIHTHTHGPPKPTAAQVVELIGKYEAALRPRLFVVKNYKLKRLFGLSVLFPEQVLNTTHNKTAGHLLKGVACGAVTEAQEQAANGKTVGHGIRRQHCMLLAAASFAAGIVGGGLLMGPRRRRIRMDD